MAYEKVGWKDYPDKTTPTSAANLNKMDEGIANNDKNIGDMSKVSDQADGTLAGIVAEQAEEIKRLKKENDELNNKYDDCFQSVSNGKAKVASAITGKGVTTASDATFDVMANNIKSIPVGKCIYLGSGYSFNVTSVCANNGIDYKKLTNSNFIVGAYSISGVRADNSNYVPGSASALFVTKANGCALSYNYNASNGVLTISGYAQSVYAANAWDGDRAWSAVTQYMNCQAWLVYTG